MQKITIQEIGPLKNLSIDLKRINIFIGPQSCGKSTLAKIISFCQWIEKETVQRQDSDFLNSDFLNTTLLQFHNISDFVHENSYISYESDVISLEIKDYKDNKFQNISLSKRFGFADAVLSKTAYIPADRNIVFVPGVFSMDMPKNYLRSFLFDWDKIRRKFGKSEPVKLLDIAESYYFNDSTGMDTLRMKNGKDLPMMQASSGIQSVTPLYLYLSYLTEWIYTHEEDLSVDKIRRIKRGALAKFMNVDHSTMIALSKENEEDFINNIIDKIETRFPNIQPHLRKFEEQVGKPHFSNIVIEEPEQNLFPTTQAYLIYDMLAMINHERDNIVITTHSPFILYAVNNCMLAYESKDKIDSETANSLDFCEKSYLNPDGVAVWEIRDGYIEDIDGNRNITIQNNQGLIGSNYFDRVMGNIMADYHNML